MSIVPANEFFKLNAVAVHARNLNEFHITRNIVFVLTRCGGLCPTPPEARRHLH